jgi:hypothetical protein
MVQTQWHRNDVVVIDVVAVVVAVGGPVVVAGVVCVDVAERTVAGVVGPVVVVRVADAGVAVGAVRLTVHTVEVGQLLGVGLQVLVVVVVIARIGSRWASSSSRALRFQ